MGTKNNKAGEDKLDTNGSNQNLSWIVQLAFSASNRVRRILASKRTKATILYKKVTFRELLTGILLVIPSAATTILTYYGVSIPVNSYGHRPQYVPPK